MPRNIPLSIIALAKIGVTCYERGEDGVAYCQRRSKMIYCWSFKFGIGVFETGRVSEWRIVALGLKGLQDGG